MAGKSDTFENDLLKFIFQNLPITTGIATSDGSTAVQLPATSTAGNLYLALHTADPGDAGNQTTSEISYTGYARVAVARTSGAWVVTNNSVSPAAAIDFPEMTGGAGGTATHVSVGTAASGAGKILYSGELTPTIAVATGVIPRIKTTSTITES